MPTDDAWAPPPDPPIPVSEEGPDLGLLLDVWFHPRITTRVVLDHGASYLVVPLWLASGLAGFSFDADEAVEMAGAVVAFGLIGGPVLAVLGGAIQSAVILFCAGLLGEQSTFREVFAALAWGQAPSTLAGLVAAPFGVAATLGLLAGAHSPVQGGLYGIGIVVALTSLWSVVTTVAALSEALRCSPGRTILVLMVAGLGAFVLGLFAIVTLTVIGRSLN